MSVDDNIYLYERAFSRRESSPGGEKGLGPHEGSRPMSMEHNLHKNISHISVDIIFMKQLCKTMSHYVTKHLHTSGQRAEGTSTIVSPSI